MRRHPQLLHLCHLRPAAAIAARCWHHHASLSHEPRGHSHCRARPAWPNRHLVGAHRGHPQPQPDRCACVQCGRWWLGRAAGSRPCAGDVACHGWPVLWRQSSRSAPRPWLRGCLQAAPRDPGSGVRCVYRSSYGYTRVYWSQLPAVGAFGRVWWPWRTMRTQKVAFLTLWDPLRFGNSPVAHGAADGHQHESLTHRTEITTLNNRTRNVDRQTRGSIFASATEPLEHMTPRHM